MPERMTNEQYGRYTRIMNQHDAMRLDIRTHAGLGAKNIDYAESIQYVQTEAMRLPKQSPIRLQLTEFLRTRYSVVDEGN